MQTLKETFSYPVGFSDNGSDDLVPVIAVALGADIIEKHFTLSKSMKGPDHSISCTPLQLKKMIQNIRLVEKILGDGKKICQPSEMKNRIAARRSIIALKTIKKNSKISKEMIGIKRPAIGIKPKFFDEIINRKATRTIEAETPLRRSDVDWTNL
jgi:sialic acid synthase SpsE